MTHRRKARSRPPEAMPQPVRRTPLEKAARALELPPDVVRHMAHVELSGNREAVVEGCRGILEYEENVIRLNTARGNIRFSGRELTLKNLTSDSAVIEGFITSVEFSE